MVLTATADTHYRAKVTAKFLTQCQRTDVVVGIGQASETDAEFQLPYVADYDLASYPGRVEPDGIQAMIDLVHASEEPITLITLGPVPNIKEALKRDPSIAAKLNYIGMQGSIDVGYNGGEPAAEWNVASHIGEFRAALAGDWLSFKITPLDTCGLIIIDGQAYQDLKASKSAGLRAVFENYGYWTDLVTWEKPDYFETRTSNLYDIVPIYMAYADEWLEYEPMQIIVDDEGFTRRAEKGASILAAMHWKNVDAFYAHVVQRLLQE